MAIRDTCPGLEIFVPPDTADDADAAPAAEWCEVPAVPGGIVVNIGDMVQVWSNDRFRAAMHRVRPMHGVERFSLPYFFNPSYRTDVEPITESIDDPPRYATVNWGAFRQGRADGDFGDYGDEIQIAQFRI